MNDFPAISYIKYLSSKLVAIDKLDIMLNLYKTLKSS
jgi:hypothetical protein